MNPLGLVGAVVGGVVGALVWGLFTYMSGWEVGYLAWGVGGLVGFGCLCLGGRGQSMAVACAVVALLSIVGGKFFGTHMALADALDEASRDLHEEMLTDAKDFASVESEFDYPEFMISHEYTDAEAADGIHPEEIAYFKEYSAPLLRELNASPAFETWEESEFAENYRQNVTASLSVQSLVLENLGPIDIIFFFLLGVVTAFQMTHGHSRAEENEEAQAQAMVAAAEREGGLHEQREQEKEAEPQV